MGYHNSKTTAYAYVSKAMEDETVPGHSPKNVAWAFSVLLLSYYQYQLAYENPPTTLVTTWPGNMKCQVSCSGAYCRTGFVSTTTD